MCNETPANDECRVVDVEALGLWYVHQCRAADPRGQYFNISGCAAGRVINIHSALLGYSKTYYPDTTPPRCPDRNCTVSTDVPTQQCNGRQSCRISQTILIYQQNSQLCRIQKDGNFIEITFECIFGITSTSCLHLMHAHCDRK